MKATRVTKSTMFERESDIESYLVSRVEKAGGLCWKWTAPSVKGVPDRIVLLPDGIMAFVELKRGWDGQLSAIQKEQIRRIMNRGHRVFVPISKADVDLMMWELIGGDAGGV